MPIGIYILLYIEHKLTSSCINGKRSDPIDGREVQQHVIAIGHTGTHVVQDMAADPDIADVQNVSQADRAIGHPEPFLTLPSAVAAIDNALC